MLKGRAKGDNPNRKHTAVLRDTFLIKGKAKGVNPERKSGAEVPKMDGVLTQNLPELSDVDALICKLLRRALMPLVLVRLSPGTPLM